MKHLFLLFGLISLISCSSAPKKEISQSEITSNLMNLSNAYDYVGINKFFEDYATCNNPDTLVGCAGRETGFDFSDRRDLLTADEFIRNHQMMVKKIKSDLEKCGNDTLCLSNIELSNPINYQRTVAACGEKGNSSATCQRDSYKLQSGEKVFVFSNPQDALSGSWLPKELIETFNKRFVLSATAINDKNLPLIEADKASVANKKSAQDQKSKAIIEKINQMKCKNLPGYLVVQKLDNTSYEVARPDVHKTFNASQAMGGASSGFIEAGPHAILTTTKTEFRSEGYLPSNFYVKETGVRKIQLKNGFTETYPVYKESSDCSDLFKQLYNQ